MVGHSVGHGSCEWWYLGGIHVSSSSGSETSRTKLLLFTQNERKEFHNLGMKYTT